MVENLTAGEDEWPECTRYVVWSVARLPPLKPGDLDRSESARDLDCMRDGIPLSIRLGRQIFPRRRIRDCCTYHSVDWHRASAVAIDVARRVPEAPKAWDRGIQTASSGGRLSAASVNCSPRALSLMPSDVLRSRCFCPEDGIILGHMAGDDQLSYTGGMHRAHALLIAGVRRTVIIRSRCCRPDRDCR